MSSQEIVLTNVSFFVLPLHLEHTKNKNKVNPHFIHLSPLFFSVDQQSPT